MAGTQAKGLALAGGCLLAAAATIAPAGAIELTPLGGMPPTDHVGPGVGIDYFASGLAFADFDNDHSLDLVMTSSSAGNVLLANAGNGVLQVSPRSADIALPGAFHGGALALDYDNDGWRDLLVLSLDRVQLFRNQAGEGFADVTVASGLGDLRIQGESAAAGDIDGDGLLDIYLVGWFDIGHPLTSDRLLRQRQGGGFDDWSAALTLATRARPGFAASMLDLDDDGDLDIYVVNDKQVGNALWRNDGPGCGSWCFTDVAAATGAARPVFGMGLGHGDYDHDGDLDLYFSSIGEQVLLRNELQSGHLAFTDVGSASGTRFTGIGWGAELVDLDNDGWLDIYLCTMNSAPSMGNRVYRNRGDGSFDDVSLASGGSDNGPSVGLARGDFDDDGRIDLAIGNWRERYVLYRNQTAPGGNWLGLRLIGTGAVNRDAVGAKVYINDSAGRRHRRDVHLGSGMGGSGDVRIHVGLGNASATDGLIRWPDGTIQWIAPVMGAYQDVVYAGVPEWMHANGFE